MKAEVFFIPLLFGFFLTTICGCEIENYEKEQFIDSRDGNVYRTIKIGNQEWMAENLKFLPNLVHPGTQSRILPCYYLYEYYGVDISEAKLTDNYNNYGVLYNWVAAIEACPKGWHLPRYAEWMKLVNYLGGENKAGSKLKKTGTSYWEKPNTGANDDVRFTALPGGIYQMNGIFSYMGYYGYWWIAAEVNDIFAWYLNMSYDRQQINTDYKRKESGYSIRCVRD